MKYSTNEAFASHIFPLNRLLSFHYSDRTAEKAGVFAPKTGVPGSKTSAF